MSESVHDKLLLLQQELETLSTVKSQMEKAGKISATLLASANDSLKKAALVLTSADDLRASTSKLVDRTEAIDFEKWLSDIRAQVAASLSALEAALKDHKVTIVKSIDDQFQSLSAAQKVAFEQQHQQLKNIEQSMLREIQDVESSLRQILEEQQRSTKTKLIIVLLVAIVGAGASLFAAVWPFVAP